MIVPPVPQAAGGAGGAEVAAASGLARAAEYAADVLREKGGGSRTLAYLKLRVAERFGRGPFFVDDLSPGQEALLLAYEVLRQQEESL